MKFVAQCNSRSNHNENQDVRKSKYLILSEFYFYFNDDLTEITNVKELFENQNILDLERFNDLKIIKFNVFSENQIKHLRLPKNIEIIGDWAFANNKIEILDLSYCINLKNIEEYAFKENQIKHLKLPNNIEEIKWAAFLKNQIKILDLSNCIKLKNIREAAFRENQIKHLKLPKNIEKIEWCAFMNNQIQILDLSNCIKLKHIVFDAFSSNPLNEIKILGDIELKYDLDDHNIWNRFVKYYNKNNKKSGDYKLENNKWQWYPL